MKRQILLLKRIKRFFTTAFIGGIVVILPMAILFVVLNWLFNLITNLVHPITQLLTMNKDFNNFLVNILAVAILITFSFLLGLIVRTRVGNSILLFFEEIIFHRIPFYKTIKDTVQHLFGNKNSPFSKIALVDVYGSETRMTAFITEEHLDGSYTVFVPTGPNPTSGNIFHLKAHQVELIKVPVEEAMRTIIACGSGSAMLIDARNKKALD